MKKTFLALIAFTLAASANAAGAAEPSVQKVTVRAVTHFDFDKASLSPDQQAAIMSEVASMKGVTWQTVTATGHTDSIGPVAYNRQLAQRRAGTVKAYLLSNGLTPDMVRTASKASAAPVASNDTADGRAKNRRTEIEFQGVRAAQ